MAWRSPGSPALRPAPDDHGPEAGADCGVDPETARGRPDALVDARSGPEGRGVPRHGASDLARPRAPAPSGLDVQVHDGPRRGGQDLRRRRAVSEPADTRRGA